MNASVNTILLKVLIGGVLFASWMLLTFYPQAGDASIVTFIQMSLAGLAGHIATSKGNVQ